MAITDIQISEELETNAPSIKYRGNEGPKSPQEMEQMMVAQLEEEYAKYVFEMQEQGLEPMSLQRFIQQAIAEGQMSGGQPLPQDPTKPVNPFQPKPQGPALPNRQMAAFGGIMGLDGRRRYGWGSKIKKKIRNIIPNEVAKVAEVAAPFVAPFNPLAAGLMSGIGGFDRHGSIGKGLKSGLMNYGMGQVARVAGGAGPQWGISNTAAGPNATFMQKYLSSPMATKAPKFTPSGNQNVRLDQAATLDDWAGSGRGMEAVYADKVIPKTANIIGSTETGGLWNTIKDFALDNKLLTGLAAGSLGAAALMGNMEPDEIQDLQRGPGLDIEGIRTEVIEAYKDESGEKLKALSVKYPFLRKKKYVDVDRLANGGRIGRAEGGIMDLGGMEKDYRAEGGFVPIGKQEKADDVPARLSVNEFVFTADAVRNAGGGDIDKGAEVMENMMKNLEAGGRVSEESQGLAGAQQMFETSERLSEVI
jgi:hypothetical protein